MSQPFFRIYTRLLEVRKAYSICIPGMLQILPRLISLRFLLSGTSFHANGFKLSEQASSLGLAWSHGFHDCQGGMSWENEELSQRWAPLELSRREVDRCRRRVLQRYFGRGGCSFLLFLLPPVIIVLSSIPHLPKTLLYHHHHLSSLSPHSWFLKGTVSQESGTHNLWNQSQGLSPLAHWGTCLFKQ